MKKALLSFFLIIFFAGGLVGQEVLDKIVAIVGDNIVLRSELQQLAYSLAIQGGIDPEKEKDKFDTIQKNTLDELIIQKALLVKAKQDTVVVSERQVDEVLNQQIEQMVRRLGSEKRVEEYFGTSLREVRRDFRKEVEERLLVQELQRQKSLETHISRREIEQFYKAYRDSLPTMKEAVHIRHILVNVQASGEAIEAARKRGQEIRQRLLKGEDFETLARQYSDGPSASKGGNLGVAERGSFVPEYEEAAFALEPGQISDLVQTKFGLHIIQLLEKAGDKIKTRHILFRVDMSPDDEIETQKMLITLKDSILANQITFEEAAKRYSKDKQTASKGGDLGWFEPSNFQIEAFQKAVEGLKPGEISSPVKTEFGYHLVKVDERRHERKLDIVKDWEQIENWALDFKRRKEFEKYVAEVRAEVYIEVKTL